ncbi:MAG: ABC transporter ATP-binding protein [Clostridia bacterium]|nr:ABC transporter ATP-binding protein [Clostridia bacterium]
MIEIKQLTKRYGERIALNGLDVKLMNGKIYGLLGPNGAGKSTTMNMMTGCLTPTSGSVRINGFDIVEQPLEAKRFIGYLPEQPPLYPDMTPEEYLCFIAEVKGVAPERVMRQVSEVMEMTNITDRKDTLIRHLSKGYGQRVGIAQAMLGNPEIIILDEPTVGLDPKQIVEIRELIRRMSEGRTVIISSHILAEISELCDELLVLSGGSLVAKGTLEELDAMIDSTETLLLTVRGDREGVCAVLDGIEGAGDYEVVESAEQGTVSLKIRLERGSEARDTVVFRMVEHHYAVVAMELEQQTLERVFLALTEPAPAAVREEAAEEAETPECEVVDSENDQTKEDGEI